MKVGWSLLLAAAFAANAEVIEAEAGKLEAGTARIEENKDASGGKFVRLTGKDVMKTDAVKLDAPQIVIPFKVDADGTYRIVLYVFTTKNGDDSCFCRVDQEKLVTKHFDFPKTSAPSSPVSVKLTAGDHVFEIFRRESNCGIDKIEIIKIR